MTSGGWHGQEQRHGRHRSGAGGAAWTSAPRPAETGPAPARPATTPPSRPSDTATPPDWPADAVPRPASPGDTPAWRAAHHGAPGWPGDTGLPYPGPGTDPLAVVYALPETGPVETVSVENAPIARVPADAVLTGLRKFDLGTVPASVTPPRSWRKAAWFAVATSAAVVLGLTVATAQLVRRPVEGNTTIDALPAYPTGPLTLAELPPGTTSGGPSRTTSSRAASTGATTPRPSAVPPGDTIVRVPTVATTGSPGGGTSMARPSATIAPTRTTVGAPAITLTDPQRMGDLTEAYFALVTSDPRAAHALTAGGVSRAGPEGIAARYRGVRCIEIHDITIDRNRAVTTSRVRVVRQDGTATVEKRLLRFTWGGDPRITKDATTE